MVNKIKIVNLFLIFLKIKRQKNGPIKKSGDMKRDHLTKSWPV